MKLERQSVVNPNTKEIDRMVQMLRDLLEEKETSISLEDLCSFQEPRGSFGLLDSDEIPYDIKVEYNNIPTYISTAILMKEYLKGNEVIKDNLIKGLDYTVKTRFTGHGFDAEKTRVDSLKIFIKGKLSDFLENEREICPLFHNMVHNILHSYNSNLFYGRTFGPWGENYRQDWEEITDSLKTNKRLYIAYGSNMNKKQMEYRCPDAKIIGKTYLENWELTMPFYANIEIKKGKKTPILLWEISAKDEAKLDRYEVYPRGYDKKDLLVNVNNSVVSAMAYIMTDEYKKKDGIAYSGYIEGIIQGYVDAGFDKSEFNPRIMNI